MPKFNTKAKDTSKTVNHEGAVAYSMDKEMELYSAVVTTILSDKFYESANDNLSRIKTLIKSCHPEFVAKLAIYAREKMYLRSIPLVLTVELAKIHNGDDLISNTASRVIQRADEITELLSYYVLANNLTGMKKLKTVSNQIQKGLRKAFNKFNEYNFAKYDGGQKAITLKDALFISHPKAKDEAQQALFDKIVKGELSTPDTWEVELSASKDKKASWERLIEENKLGYMALLRNLRNILEAKVSVQHIQKVADKLSNSDEVAKSKQFPFRFLSAYTQLGKGSHGHASIILDALEDAVLCSAENIKGFDIDTRVLIATDLSSSMDSRLNDKSTVRYKDIGLMLSMLLQTKCKNVITGGFGETWKRINLSKKSILANTVKVDNLGVGHSTNGWLILEDLIRNKEVVDKVMIFSDLQIWDSGSYGVSARSIQTLWSKYKAISPEAKLYLFDLAGHGTTPVSMKGGNVYLIAGWSDKVFDMLAAYESGTDALKEIHKIEL